MVRYEITKMKNICTHRALYQSKSVLFLLQSPYIPRIFELFDKDGSGTISFGEMIDGFQLMINGSPEDKLKFLFDVTDISGIF